jgi:hypothetical protein
MVKMDHCVTTTAVAACLWLVHGDDYLLVFWQVCPLLSLCLPGDPSALSALSALSVL